VTVELKSIFNQYIADASLLNIRYQIDKEAKYGLFVYGKAYVKRLAKRAITCINST
jgi:hypothetical protein